MLKYTNMSEKVANKEKIDDILTRGVGEFIDPDGVFRKKLENNPENIIIKFGVDPTRPDIHLGHAVVLRKLRQLQDMGCKVIFLIGDITAQIGDPTGKSQIRPEVNMVEIQKNMKTYLDQVGKILNKESNVFDWITNSDWFVSINDIIVDDNPISKVEDKAKFWAQTRMQKNKNNLRNYSFINVLAVLRQITHGRLIERDMFQKRLKNGEPIFMHEMLYPVMQGIDSNVLFDVYGACDLEVGGTDQHFNMLVGREVMEMNKRVPQSVLSFKLLEGTDGKEKMSKSLDNYIGITDEPNNMYGKVMSIPDSSIGNYFELCTFTSLPEVEKIRRGILDDSIHPKEIKMDLAKQIVSIYYGEEKAEKAQENWENTFSKKEIPSDVPVVEVKEGDLFADVFTSSKIVSSKADFRRLVEEGAVTNMDTDEKVSSYNDKVKDGVYKIGKKRFCKIKIIK